MDSARQTPIGERHSLVPNSAAAPGSRRSSLAVPLLDEESLKINSNVNANGGGGGGGFTLVSQADDVYHSGMNSHEASLRSPEAHAKSLDHNQIYNMLQQQQAVALAAAQLEQAYNQTCYLLQQCSPNALLTILMSLLNDYPTTLVQPIRARVEQVLAQQMSPSASSRGANSTRKVGSNFVPNSSAAPWTPSNMHGGSAAPTPTANGTPGAHRRGRGHKGKEEEQEMCSLHNNMRAMKHLQLNQSTGLYECIHGFHCLVDGPADLSPKRTTTTTAAMTPSLSNSASRGSNPPASTDMPAAYVSAALQAPPAPLQQPQQQSQQPSMKGETRFSATEVEALRMLGYSLSNNSNSGSTQSNGNGVSQTSQLSRRNDGMGHHRDPEVMGGGAGSAVAAAAGGGYTVVGNDRSSSHGNSPMDARLNMDLPSLEYLLQSVRDIDDD